MKRRGLASTLALGAGLITLGLVGVLLLLPQAPKPIRRAAIQYATATPSAASSTPGGGTQVPRFERVQATASATAQSRKPNPFGPPRFAPRPAEEWQGMLVNMNITPPCESSVDCGLARACLELRCMPCEADSECARGEACVLQHCLRAELVECRYAAECGADSKCILSGYSSEPRGNEGIRAYCVSSFSGASEPSAPEEPPPPDARTSLPGDDLLNAARAAARSQ